MLLISMALEKKINEIFYEFGFFCQFSPLIFCKLRPHYFYARSIMVLADTDHMALNEHHRTQQKRDFMVLFFLMGHDLSVSTI
jgi:hypothetical protein